MEVTNRFKGSDLIDRVPEKLWLEVCDIVQEAVIKTIPRKRNAKEQNGCLTRPTNSVKRREANSKGGKERDTHLNAEFQRIARRDKKAFLGDQCKEIEENNRMGKKDQISLQENQSYQGNITCKDGHKIGQKWYGPNRSRRY